MSRDRGAGLALLQRAEQVEASLWRRFRLERNDLCREDLFARYLSLAQAIAAREFRRRPAYGLERVDFEQLATAGLLEAIDRFDPLKGAPFVAFAKYRIRGAIVDGIARSSESGAQYSFRRRLEIERLQSLAANRDATADPLAELSTMVAGLAIGLIAEGAGHSAHDPLESRAWREMQQTVIEEITRLPPAQRAVMENHYLRGVAFTQIAHLMGITKGRVSQLHRAAITQVRARLRRFD